MPPCVSVSRRRPDEPRQAAGAFQPYLVGRASSTPTIKASLLQHSIKQCMCVAIEGALRARASNFANRVAKLVLRNPRYAPIVGVFQVTILRKEYLKLKEQYMLLDEGARAWAVYIGDLVAEKATLTSNILKKTKELNKLKSTSKVLLKSEVDSLIKKEKELADQTDSESWKFFDVVYGIKKGYPVAVVNSDGKVLNGTYADKVKVSTIAKGATVVLTVIGESTVKEMPLNLPYCGLIQVFEDKNVDLMVMS